MTDDSGLAALAERLRTIHAGPLPWPRGQSSDEFAAAILGERGAFLPDGLPSIDGLLEDFDGAPFPDEVQQAVAVHDAVMQTEIERLRAALRETLGLAVTANGGDHWYAKDAGIDAEAVIARARAALEPQP